MRRTTITCVVCGDEYTYEYKGGRKRVTCDGPDCKRKRENFVRAEARREVAENPDGEPDEYPASIVSLEGAVGHGEVGRLRDEFHERYLNRRLRERHAPVDPEGREAVEAPDESVDVPAAYQGSVPDVLASGHGVGMDDYVDLADTRERPYRWIPGDKRKHTDTWLRALPPKRRPTLPVKVGTTPTRALYVLGDVGQVPELRRRPRKLIHGCQPPPDVEAVAPLA